MSSDGWVRVTDGFYAKGRFRILRQSRDWGWWDVVQLAPDFARGRTRTLREAKLAATQAAPDETEGAE